MSGVKLPRWLVRTWPRFPLIVLEDDANLVAFVAVLDRIVTESRPIQPVVPAAA